MGFSCPPPLSLWPRPSTIPCAGPVPLPVAIPQSNKHLTSSSVHDSTSCGRCSWGEEPKKKRHAPKGGGAVRATNQFLRHTPGSRAAVTGGGKRRHRFFLAAQSQTAIVWASCQTLRTVRRSDKSPRASGRNESRPRKWRPSYAAVRWTSLECRVPFVMVCLETHRSTHNTHAVPNVTRKR